MGARARPRTTPSIVSHHPSRNRCASLKYNGERERPSTCSSTTSPCWRMRAASAASWKARYLLACGRSSGPRPLTGSGSASDALSDSGVLRLTLRLRALAHRGFRRHGLLILRHEPLEGARLAQLMLLHLSAWRPAPSSAARPRVLLPRSPRPRWWRCPRGHCLRSLL